MLNRSSIIILFYIIIASVSSCRLSNPFNNPYFPDARISVKAGTSAFDQNGIYDFSYVYVLSSSTEIFTIENVGNTDLTISDIILSGNEPNQFTKNTTSLTRLIKPLAKTSFTLKFSPISEGAKSAVVSIISNNPYLNMFIINLKGNAMNQNSPNARISVKAGNSIFDQNDMYDFSSVDMLSSSTEIFTIENVGNTDLTISDITLGGNDPDQFTLSAGSLTRLIEPLAKTSFTLKFSPTSEGAKSAVVSIISNDPYLNMFIINLKGNATNPNWDPVRNCDKRPCYPNSCLELEKPGHCLNQCAE